MYRSCSIPTFDYFDFAWTGDDWGRRMAAERVPDPRAEAGLRRDLFSARQLLRAPKLHSHTRDSCRKVAGRPGNNNINHINNTNNYLWL